MVTTLVSSFRKYQNIYPSMKGFQCVYVYLLIQRCKKKIISWQTNSDCHDQSQACNIMVETHFSLKVNITDGIYVTNLLDEIKIF